MIFFFCSWIEEFIFVLVLEIEHQNKIRGP